MEQDLKVGASGEVKLEESVVGESLTGSLPVGPLDVQLSIKIDNAKLLALVAARLPGGLMHDVAIRLQSALFPVPA